MRVSASDHCETTILLPSSILAKGQINEECLVRNVESWESLSFADTSDLVWRRFLGFWCCLSYISCWCCRLYGFQESCRYRESLPSKIEQSIEHLLSCRKNTSTCGGRPCSNPVRIDPQYRRKGTPFCGKSLSYLSYISCWCCRLYGFQESCCYQESCCLLQFRARMSRALNNFCRAGRIWKNTSTCASPTSCQTCQLMWVFMQQSSSYRSPVLKKGNTCGCQPVTTVRQPFSCQVPSSQRVRSMKSVSFGMLKAETGWAWQTPQTCVKKIPWFLMLLCYGFQESCRYRESCCLFRFRARMSRALNIFCRAGRIQAPLLVQCLASLANWCGRSCGDPVHINHKYWRKGTHAGVSQWPLWENHPLPSFHTRQRSDQWRVSRSECWKLRKLEFCRHLRPCVKTIPWFLMLP